MLTDLLVHTAKKIKVNQIGETALVVEDYWAQRDPTQRYLSNLKKSLGSMSKKKISVVEIVFNRSDCFMRNRIFVNWFSKSYGLKCHAS